MPEDPRDGYATRDRADLVHRDNSARDRRLPVAERAQVHRNSYAREEGANLIAMATHGRGAVGQLVQGSVAAEVLRSGVAPVLLVRPQSLERRS